MANASVVIKGVNQMSKAVNGAIQDLGKIKTAANNASKTLRNVFELGTTVAVLKKVVKLSKEYFNNITDPKVQASFDRLKKVANDYKNAFKGIIDQKMAPFLDTLATKLDGARGTIENILNAISGVFSNIPEALGIIGTTLAEIVSGMFSFNNFKTLITDIYNSLVSVIQSIAQVAVGYADYFITKLTEKFWDSDIGTYFKKLNEKQLNSNGSNYLKMKANRGFDIMTESTDRKSADEVLSDLNKTIKLNLNNVSTSFSSTINDFADVVSPYLEGMNEKLGNLTNGSKITISSGESNTTETTTTSAFKTGILEVVAKLKAFITNLNPVVILIRLIATAVERFLSVLGNGIDTVLQPLFDIFAWAGQIAAEQFMPILDRLYPIIQMGAVMIEELTNAVATHLAPIIEFVAAVLEILSPILTLVTKAFIILMAPAQWLADAFKWLAEWIKYLGNAISTAIYNIFHPLNQRSMTASKPGSFTSDAFSGLSDRLARVDALGSTTAGLTNGTSTSSAISSASYNGATSVTINIYQQAAVVGDSGMRQFAQMIRNEFEKLDYYGVTV